MKVLLTGNAGFIGSVIHRKLAGHDVTGVDIRGRYSEDARDFFRDNCCSYYDLVIHCAAQVGGRVLVESPMVHAENLEIDAALFQWAEHARPGRIVYVSSVAVYPKHLQKGEYKLRPLDSTQLFDKFNISSFSGDAHIVPRDLSLVSAHVLHEDNALNFLFPYPDELYGWAKLTGEMMAARSSVPVSIPRPFTVYGEDQDPVFPFANIAMQIRERRDPVTVWGSGKQIRDFIHVDDVADGILEMAKQGIDGPVNICTGRATSLNDLIRLMADKAGYYPDIEHLNKTEGLAYRVGDPKKLHEFYVPKVTLEEGVARAQSLGDGADQVAAGEL
ncbi:MAG TPA: NAD(P)-dependent oxidoreductase [Puia sp.]|nr:NAD(P)-dependent oxidoreductase [Puia sp.]